MEIAWKISLSVFAVFSVISAILAFYLLGVKEDKEYPILNYTALSMFGVCVTAFIVFVVLSIWMYL